MTAYRCSVASRERAEPLFATASRVDRWLVVEQRGAWSGETVPRSRLGRSLATGLSGLAAEAGARLLLVRRPGGVPATGRRVFFADSRPGREQLFGRVVADDDELPGLRQPAAQPREWSPVGDRLLLVCTHGRHDACCAIWGRPVARALAGRYPQETWECTHFGGDRFAPNLVVLPEGYYFGRLPPESAAEVVSTLDDGRLATPYFRGRSGLALPVQAAQHFARQELASTATADLAPVRQQRRSEDSWEVILRSRQYGDVAVTVRRVPQPAHRLTCCSLAAKSFAFELVELSTSG